MPGIHLYTGNKLERLADRFVALLQSDPLPPLQKEIVLVQSRGMARWLALETASRAAIWANIDCPFPNTFTRFIFSHLVPDIPDIILYQKKFITWHLMAILPGLLNEQNFNKVRSYLASGNDQKLYQLAFEIADLFDQYTLYRPEMIRAWEKGEKNGPDDQDWQATLWRRLMERLSHSQYFSEFHRAKLLEITEKKLLNPSLDCSFLPARITVFGVSSLPPYHLAILSALARHVHLHFFVMNPCREFWFDIIADKDIVKISRKEDTPEEILHLEQGNSLLASMGHLGRDFLAQLQDLDCKEEELFSYSGATNLLAGIQKDILNLQEVKNAATKPSSGRKTVLSSDKSITFQSCHSPMREIEILYDHLLDIFNGTSDAEPHEPRNILVMAPDINEYAPLIRSVFGAGSSSVKIPYSISDQSIEKNSQLIETFFKILAVSESRLSAIDVMALLDSAPIKNRFAFTDHDISVLHQWIDDTRICWGIDADHKKNLELPDYQENTWRAGLDRLLLGFAMPGHDRILFENILPYDLVEGSNAELLGRFLDFCESLFDLVTNLQQPHTLFEWSALLIQAKEDFLHANEWSEIEDSILYQALIELRDLPEMTDFSTPITLGVIRSFLHEILEEHFASAAGNAGFLTGGITFCSMLPMRAIPFKTIYLLGMNDGSYPRRGRKRSFDITALAPKRGDRSRRHDDRYLFLETLLSARKQLFISFVGQAIQDGSKRPPSVLVSELMDYIENNYTLKTQDGFPVNIVDHLTVHHRLQPFHPDYFRVLPQRDSDKLFSYSQENSEASIVLAEKQHRTNTLSNSPLSLPPEEYRQITINELVLFFSHPVRYLMCKRIGIASIDELHPLNTSEPFDIKGLDRYILENEILAHLSAGGDNESLYQIKKAAGQLPHGKIGKVYFSRIFSEVQAFRHTIDALIAGQKLEELEIELDIDDFKIKGRMENIGTAGMVQFRYATIKAKDIIRSWICHLILNRQQQKNISDSMKHTFLAGKDKTIQFQPVAENNPFLKQILSIYWLGLIQPLDFFPRASYAFAQAVHNGKSEEDAMRLASREWEGNKYTGPGEKYDPYNSLCFKNTNLSGKDFPDLAKKVFLPALAHQVPYKP